jgi:hypothetical protein
MKLNTSSNTFTKAPSMNKIRLESTTKTDLNNNVESWVKSKKVLSEENQQLEKAKRYETPVKIESSGLQNEDGYESPIFIHKKERLDDNHKEIQYDKVTQVNLKQDMQNDIQAFMSQFNNSQDKDERLKICKFQ